MELQIIEIIRQYGEISAPIFAITLVYLVFSWLRKKQDTEPQILQSINTLSQVIAGSGESNNELMRQYYTFSEKTGMVIDQNSEILKNVLNTLSVQTAAIQKETHVLEEFIKANQLSTLTVLNRLDVLEQAQKSYLDTKVQELIFEYRGRTSYEKNVVV